MLIKINEAKLREMEQDPIANGGLIQFALRMYKPSRLRKVNQGGAFEASEATANELLARGLADRVDSPTLETAEE